MRYRFNDRIIFDVDNGTLSLTDISDDPIPISNPSIRLLLLLIAHHGDAVSREVIFKKVWDDYGMVSSNNNLNQCVSKLRRVIKALGIDDEVIVTVPKMGFVLSREILVQICEGENSTFVEREDVSTARDTKLKEAKVPLASSRASIFQRIPYKWGVLAFICIVLLGITVNAFSPISREEAYLGKAGSCKVFVSAATEDFVNADSGLIKDIFAFAGQQKAQCDADEYLLLVHSNQVKSYVSNVSRLFFLRCKVLREHQIEICSGLESEKTLLL
ncbi:transcriptional regulator [Serratia aquatilis]